MQNDLKFYHEVLFTVTILRGSQLVLHFRSFEQWSSAAAAIVIIMSAEVESESDSMMCCASCGIAQVGDKHAKSGWRNCVTKSCSSNLRAAAMVTARFVFCRYRLI
jgi:hypothetical protein